MRAVTKLVFLDENNEKFFGEGPWRLLRAVEETGSLNAAAASMDMAYTKAMKMLKNAEKALGFKLTERTVGGRNGGGSRPTAECLEWLERYEAYRAACIRENQRLYREYYPQKACVIMASGLGKRFGGNKLTADFCGQPMIGCALDATEGLFEKRVVVTRHDDVAAYCGKRNVEVVLHDLPKRNDTVRLGIEAVGDMDVCMFLPGDQPLLRRETVSGLIRCWEKDRDFIWRTECEGAAGLPAAFPAWCFDELARLPEGRGGGTLMEKYPEKVRCMNVEDGFELMDADTTEALERLKQHVRDEKGC